MKTIAPGTGAVVLDCLLPLGHGVVLHKSCVKLEKARKQQVIPEDGWEPILGHRARAPICAPHAALEYWGGHCGVFKCHTHMRGTYSTPLCPNGGMGGECSTVAW